MKLKVWQTLLIVCVACVFSALGFTGCGSSRDGMSLTVESSSITTDSEGRDVVDLVKAYDNAGVLADSAYAQISVQVINGDSSIDRTISAVSSSNSQVSTSVVYNSETGISIVTLTAISPTASATSTYITITSNEDSTKQKKVYVQVQEKATAMNYSDKANATLHSSTVEDPDIVNGFAIFKGEPFTFDTEALFTFEPNQAFVPNIVYMTSISGNYIYKNGSTYLEGVTSSLTELIISAYDLDDPSDTTFKKVFKLYIYNAIESSDISLNRVDVNPEEENVTEINLINNHTSDLNDADLELFSNTYTNGLSYKYSLNDPDAEDSILDVQQSISEPNNFTIRGLGKSVEGITITFSIYYTSIENSPVITKTLLVKVVDYPTAIEVNDTEQEYSLVLNTPISQEGYYNYYLRSGTSTSNYTYTEITEENFSSLDITVGTTACYALQDYALTVFDQYEDVVDGAELQIILQEFSEGYGAYTLHINTDNISANLQTLAENLIIKKGSGSYRLATLVGGTVQYNSLTFTSGDLLYLSTSANETGSLPIIITAVNNVDNDKPLTRTIVLNFTAGITDLEVQSGTLTTENKLLMEIGESGATNINGERKVYLTIAPTGAERAELPDGSIGCYISAVSSNANIATVGSVIPSTDTENAYLIVTARGVGSTIITLTTANGLKVAFTAVVTPLLNTVTLSLATSSESSTTSATTKTDDINATKTTLDTLTVEAGKNITLRYNIFPSTAYLNAKAVFTVGELVNDEIVSTGTVIDETTSSILTIGDVDKKSAWLRSKLQGTQYIVMTATYRSLNEARTEYETKTIVQTFTVIVYQPITSVTVSTNKIQLLEGGVAGYYNQLQQTDNITIEVGPSNSTVKASSTIWSIKTGGNSYIEITPTEGSDGTLVNGDVVGSQVTITSKTFESVETSKTVEVQALITDINGKQWFITTSVTIIKQVPVGTITVGSYDSTQGYYFEETGGLSTLPVQDTSIVDRLAVMNSTTKTNDSIAQYELLNVRVQYSVEQPTNNNLAYFLFDATVDNGNNWAVSGDKIRNYSSSNIWLGYDETSSKYFITPISSGYTIIYIIPQDKLSLNANEITSVADLIGKGGYVLHITVADGYVTYYRLYNADDIAKVSNNSSVWDRNYYIMNDIDMSSYCRGHYWNPIGNSTKAFTGTISSFNNSQNTLYGIELKTRDNIETGDNGNFGGYYGFFGVIGTGTSVYKDSIINCVGTIKNVNFEIMSLSIEGTVTSITSYIGTLAGRLASGAVLNNVTVASNNVTISVQASSTRTLYVGTIGENNSGITSATDNIQYLDTQYNLDILSTNSSNAIIIFGGAIATNTATLGGGVTAYSVVNTADSACANSGSIFGGAVGQTTASMSNLTSSGSIILSDKIKANTIGGITGTSRATLSNCISSVIAGNAYDIGGIVGIITDAGSIVNCSYEIYEMSGTSALYSTLAYEGRMINVGGIAGNGTNTSLNYCYVISFISTQLQEITSSYNVGGLIGRLNVSTTSNNIVRSFFNASIYGNSNNSTGGLVGYISGAGAVQILNTFVNGNINSTSTNNGLFVGDIVNSSVTIEKSYSVASTSSEMNTVGSGAKTLINVFVLEYLDGNNNENGVSYSTSSAMRLASTFTLFDFSNVWIVSSNTQINNGYPMLRSTSGTLYPVIPTSMDFSAKENANANVYNTSDSRHIIVQLKGLTSNEFSLLDLFDVAVAPTQEDNGALKVSIITSNSNVVDITYGTKLEDFRIKIMGIGTATLTITSLYNSSVYETIGIAVVNGYSDVKLYLSEDDKESQETQSGDLQIIYNIETTSPLTDVTLQVNNSEEWYVDYETNSSVSSLGGGVAFVVEDGYLTVGTNNFASINLTVRQLLQKCLNIGFNEGVYSIDIIQQAFRILIGDNNATVVQDGDNYVFSTNSTVLGIIGTEYYSGSTARVTLTRSKIINLCNTLAFGNSALYSVSIDAIATNDMQDYLVDASYIFAQFYSTSSVTLDIIEDVPYIMYTAEGYSYARCSQTGTTGNYTLYTEIFMYVESTNYATVSASIRNSGLLVTVVPYLRGTFNTTTGKVVNSAVENGLSYIWDDSITFNLIIYNGATGLYTTIGGTESEPTALEISQDISFDMILISDSPLDQANGVAITIEEQNGTTWTQVATQNITKTGSTWNATTNIETAYRTQYNFSVSNTTVSDGQISQNLVFGILDSYKSEFEQNKTYRITISNNEFITGSNIITKVVYFTFIPQGVTYIDVTHYADAELEGESSTTAGNYLTNAGAQPTDTILAGEMGLLRINLAPSYAQFNSITITSNTVSGDIVSFQQRVAKVNVINGENQTGYYFYENGVSYLPNGIIVAPVSNYDGTFDGTIWLQTLIAKQTTSASSFIITITITREGYEDIVFNYTLKVDSTSNIVLSYDGTLDANTLTPKAYVAVGTGGSDQDTVNQNLFTITTIGDFESVSAPTILDDLTGGKVVVSSANGKYYVVVTDNAVIGSTFTLQVQGIKYINGYRRTITRYMYFTVTDFVLKNNSLTISNVSGGVLDSPYYQDAYYKLQIGYNANAINANLDIVSVQNALNQFIENLNDGSIDVWAILDDNNNLISIQSPTTSGATYVYAITDTITRTVTEKTSSTANDVTNVYTAINNDYYIRLVTSDGDNNGWYICPLKQSTGNVLTFIDIDYIFNGGAATTDLDSATSYFTVPQQDITISFTQQTSLDSPIPIYTLAQLMSMEVGKDYRLMADIDTSVPIDDDDDDIYWTPLNTAISSLDGNNHTITICGFSNATVGTLTTPTNYGFFGAVNENTILKNITIKYLFASNTYSLDLMTSAAANFGGIAGINNGIIANCIVQGYNNGSKSAITISSSGALTDIFNIAGFVGINNGSISNSRVTYMQISSKGTVTGFVARNNSQIASSYVNYGAVINTSTSNDVGATGGFVGYNGGQASVKTCYVGGTYATGTEGVYTIDTSIGVRGRTQQVTSTVNTGGFVYSNSGEVQDSFSGVSLSVDASNQLGSVSGGFAYSNGTGGQIARCYSVSYAPLSNKAHTPFIGPNSTYSALNNEDDGSITSCFYYDVGFGTQSIEMTTALGIEKLTLEQFINKDNKQIGLWQDYSTSRSYDEDSVSGEEFTSVWTFLNDKNTYFKINNFLDISDDDTASYFLLGPRLVSADTISVENWASVIYNETTEKYIYTRSPVIIDGNIYTISNSLTLDTVNGVYVVSPYLIDSAETLFNVMTKDMKDNGGVISSWYRLISDIDVSDLVTLGYDLTSINQATFCGNFEGNGFTIKNLNISSGEADNFGLFAKISNNNEQENNFVSIQNLSIEVNDIAAALVSNVGTLAGSAEDVVLSNIDVYSNSSALIIGRNMVGGIVGKISGNSRVSNLSSSISVSAVYGNSTTNTLIYNADLWRLYEGDGLSSTNGDVTLTNSDNSLCYAGGIFGVADLQAFVSEDLSITGVEYNEARISNLTVTGSSKVIGTTCGGVIGLMGSSTYATNLVKKVATGAYFKGSRYAGGIIGENHGYLNYARLLYTDDIQTLVDSSIYVGSVAVGTDFALYQGTSKAIGGVVGLNVGLLYGVQTGVMENCYSKVNVKNPLSKVAGGLVGISAGGELLDCYVTGSVLSARSGTTGGAIGVACSLSYISVDVQDPFTGVSNKTSYVGMSSTEQFTIINYVVACNNWTYSDYTSLNNIRTEGQLGGFIGYIYNNKISTDNESYLTEEEYLALLNGMGIDFSTETNFYVSTIYNTQPSKKNQVTGGVVLNAIGAGSTDDIAKGLTRYEMYTDSYPQTKSKTDENLQVDRMFENWMIYSYGTMNTTTQTFKIINYDTAGMPIYKPTPNPSEIEIWTTVDFNNIKDAPSANYILMADLDFTDVDFTPVGTASNPFTGTFTGTSYNTETDTYVTHVLSNITMDYNSDYNTSAVGVFAYTNGATIQDLVIVGIELSWEPTLANATSCAGLLVGSGIDTNISNVQIIESYTRDGTTWTGENILSTSAKYVGGAIGSSTIAIREGTVEQVFVEADIEVGNINDQDIDIDTENQFKLDGVIYTIVNNDINDVDGDFVTSISFSTFTLNGFVCVINANNTITCTATRAPDVFVGGFAGITSAANTKSMSITQSYFQGSISINRKSLITAGGFVGKSAHTNYNTVFADIPSFAISNIGFSSEIGGFAGVVENSEIEYATVSGTCTVGMISNDKNFYIGGFAGKMSGTALNTGTILNSTTSLDIYFSSSVNWSVNHGGLTTQMIGGFAGSLGNNKEYVALKNICSTTTVHNNTLFENVDGFAFETPDEFTTNNSNVANVYFDKYLSLVARDINNFGVTGISLLQNDNFEKLDGTQDYSRLQVLVYGLYPSVSIGGREDISGVYYSKYYNLYQNTENSNSNVTSGSKLNPIKINLTADFNSIANNAGYKWYLQATDLSSVSLTSEVNFTGFYNGSGKTITTTRYDSIFGMAQTTQDMGIFQSITENGALSGLNVDAVVRVCLGADGSNSRTNIGILAATVANGGVVFGCYTTGQIVVTSTQQTSNVIGGLVANNSGQILVSGSIVDITINAETGKYFAVGGLVGYNANTITQYALKDCYYTGTIFNNISSSGQMFVGGIIGKVVANVTIAVNISATASIAMANVYSVAKIYGYGGLIIGTCGTGSTVKNVYYSSGIGKTSQQTGSSAIGTTFSILAQRVGSDSLNNVYDITSGITYSDTSTTTAMTKGVWTNGGVDNYGLPYLKIQVSVKDTGDGSDANPFLINNEGQLAWALSTSEGNVYYQLESDMNYTVLNNSINSSSLTFYGQLLGSGYYINNSTNSLVGTNDGVIKELGFKGTITATSNIVATSNTGYISEIYVQADGGKDFISSGTGGIINCLTNNNSVDSDGDTYSLVEKNYSDMLSEDNYDFMNTWVLQTTTAGASASFTTGTLMLSAFVDSLADINVLSTTGTVTTDGSVYTLTVGSKEQYAALLQYIARSGTNDETYIVTLTQDINMNGMIAPALLGQKTMSIVLNGAGHTIYNLIINNQHIYTNASLIGSLTNSSGISNLKLNQINFITTTSGGILVDNNSGTVTGVQVNNSCISSSSVNVDDYIGGIVGINNNSITGVSVNALTIIANGVYVGGVVGVNNSYVSVSTVENLNVKQGSNIYSIKAIGGVVGQCADASSSVVVTNSVTLNVGEGNSNTNIGGVIGYVTKGGSVNVRGSITLTVGVDNTNVGGVIGNIDAITSGTYAVYVGATIDITVADGCSSIGGVIGYTANTGAVHIYTSKDGFDAVIGITATDSSVIGGIIGNNNKSNISIKQSSIATNFTTAITITLNHNVNSTTASNTNIGGIFGANTASALTLNYDGSTTGIIITSQDGDTNIGGVVGTNNNTLQMTAFKGITIIGNSTNVGGVAGENTGTIAGTISDVTLGNDTYNNSGNVGGVVGLNSGVINKFIVSDITIKGLSNVGGVVGYNIGTVGMEGLSNGSTITNLNLVGNNNIGSVVGVNETEEEQVGLVQNISVADSVGNEISVTYLDTESDNQAVGFGMAYNNGTVINLTIDILQAGSGLNIDALENTQNNIGIIAGINSGSITNNVVQNFILTTKTSSENVGTVGQNSGTITGLSITDVIVLNGINNIGMAIGENTTGAEAYDISVAYLTSTVLYLQDGALSIGGAVGNNAGTLAGVIVQDNFTIEGTQDSESNPISANNIGGAVGYNTGTITTYTVGAVLLNNNVNGITVNGVNNIGGFVGYNSGRITLVDLTTFTVTDTTVTGTQFVGGFVGYNLGSISGIETSSIVVSTSTISGSTYVGGFTGTNADNATLTDEGLYYVTISNCTVTSNTVGDETPARVGGIAGSNASKILNVAVDNSNIKAQDGTDYGNIVGGIAGANMGSIENASVQLSSMTSIVGNKNVGGITGFNTGTITETSILGLDFISEVILGYGENVGGIAGYNTGTINSATVGENNKIIGVGLVGGIVGNNAGTISGVIGFNGAVVGRYNNASYVLGGVAGLNTGIISASITLGYKTLISGGSLLGGVVGLNQGYGDISSASVVFEVNLTEKVVIAYYGVYVYTYEVDVHDNNYTDKKIAPDTQYWFEDTTIISGDLYYIGVGYIVGVNANGADLCTFDTVDVTINQIGSGVNLSAGNRPVGI